jgi:hypothetical protein
MNEHKLVTSSDAYYSVVIYYIIITPRGLVFPKIVCDQNALIWKFDSFKVRIHLSS